MIIFAYKHTDNQVINSKTEAHSILYPLWIVGGAGQLKIGSQIKAVEAFL